MGSVGPSVGSGNWVPFEIGQFFSGYGVSYSFRGATARVGGGVSTTAWSWGVIEPFLEAGDMWL